ncbi:MAG TPA: sugar ABC transporter ATP-binding protein [Candidatus Pygmaiobacter gallistercoris]|nr:sugar ABC transporter ATP-binding protein [Candidatus Pygmaiobacter gallistercoris]
MALAPDGGSVKGGDVLEEYALQLKNITKRYPGVLALDDISVNIRKGEVHAICGENGAGKSTMMKLISGAISPDGGKICVFGKDYDQMTPVLSRELGIEVVYQEFNLVPNLPVYENIYLGMYPGGKVSPDFAQMKQKTRELFETLEADIDPRTKVKDLSTAYCQLVEIAKSVSKDPKILILDEPTAALTEKETEILFKLVDKLKKAGTTILYVSHRLSEIFDIADRVTVFRDGKVIETRNIEDIDRHELIALMAGREVKDSYPEKINQPGEVILRVKDLCGLGVENVSFEVRKGEIFGFAGLVGAGRTETARMIFGADEADSGTIEFMGKQVHIHNPEQAVALGIGLVPEDRKTQGVILNLSIRKNITLSILRLVSKFGIMDFKKENKILEEHKNALRIKTPSFDQLLRNLSGGNQQKVVVSKWLARECKLLIMDEPTRGIDVGAKQEIYNIMNRLASEGVAIIMISSEMPELIGMADRILVMSEGRQTGILERGEFSQERILEMASHEFVS